jgi:hypothetical protein
MDHYNNTQFKLPIKAPLRASAPQDQILKGQDSQAKNKTSPSPQNPSRLVQSTGTEEEEKMKNLCTSVGCPQDKVETATIPNPRDYNARQSISCHALLSRLGVAPMTGEGKRKREKIKRDNKTV